MIGQFEVFGALLSTCSASPVLSSTPGVLSAFVTILTLRSQPWPLQHKCNTVIICIVQLVGPVVCPACPFIYLCCLTFVSERYSPSTVTELRKLSQSATYDDVLARVRQLWQVGFLSSQGAAWTKKYPSSSFSFSSSSSSSYSYSSWLYEEKHTVTLSL